MFECYACRLSGTPRKPSRKSQDPLADVGIAHLSFNLMLPWQQQVLQQSDVESYEPAGAETEESSPSGPVSARFQKSLQTVNLWKAQQNLKVDMGPVSSRTTTEMYASRSSILQSTTTEMYASKDASARRQKHDSVPATARMDDVGVESLAVSVAPLETHIVLETSGRDEEQREREQPLDNLVSTILTALGGQ